MLFSEIMRVLVLMHGQSFTELAKVAFGRLRPDWQGTCFGKSWPDMVPANSSTAQCNSGLSDSLISRGRRSYPSGHTSVAAAVGLSLCWCLLWICSWRCTRYRSSRAKPSRLAAECATLVHYPLILLLCATGYVAASRVHDNQHYYSDVDAGFIVGIIFSFMFSMRSFLTLQAQWACDGHLR